MEIISNSSGDEDVPYYNADEEDEQQEQDKKRKNDIDRLFDEDQDPGDEIVAREPSPPQVSQRDEDDAELNRIHALKSEKEQLTAYAELLRRRKKQKTDPVPVPAPAKKTDTVPAKKKPAAVAEAPKKEPALFPHAGDLTRIKQYCYITAVTILITGELGAEYSSDYVVTDSQQYMTDASVLYQRCKALRKQLLAAMKERCAKNAQLASIMEVIGKCKLTIHTKAKHLVKEDDAAYCVWTGQKIADATDVRAAALTPLDQSWSHSNNNKLPGPLGRGIMFHIHAKHMNVLKCLHTLLFFIDYLNAEIQAKTRSIMEGMSAEEKKWGPETETAWRALFDTATDKKKQPMAELVGGMQRLLKECTNALRQELGDKPFVVISGN